MTAVPPMAERPSGRRRAGNPHPLDHGRPGLRRRLGLDHRRHPAEHRGRDPRRHPRPAQGAPAQPRARLRGRRRVHEVLVRGRGGEARPVRAGRRGLDPQREDQEARATGRRWAPTETGQPITTCEWIDRLAPEGAGRRRGRHLRHLRRHPRDGRQPDRLHGPGRLPRLGLDVEGRPADRQRARAARCSRTTSWRRCSTCSTRRPGWPR